MADYKRWNTREVSSEAQIGTRHSSGSFARHEGMRNAKRIAWVDYGKGFAMILVFWGHTLCPQPFRDFFYAFHMPLFFFLSGFVFSTRHYPTLRAFAVRRVRTLLVPGLVFNVIVIALEWLNGVIIGQPFNVPVLHYLLGVVLEIRGGDLGIIPWFFTSLFVIEIAMYIVQRFITSKAQWQFALGIIASLVGYGYSEFIGHAAPWALETACSGFFFFVLGKIMRQQWDSMPRWLFSAPMIVVWGAATELFAWLNRHVAGEQTDIYLNQYGWYPFYLADAIAGIMFSVALLMMIERFHVPVLVPILGFVGANSLVYYSFNNFALALCQQWLGAVMNLSGRLSWQMQLGAGGASRNWRVPAVRSDRGHRQSLVPRDHRKASCFGGERRDDEMTVPKISVIVPVYNAERYLDECVSSLTRQTFPLIEVLLVDDGSTDSSAGKCDAWASKDDRVRVIHQSNAGVSAARNAGLDHARGEWIAFADADDWLEDDAFETLLSGDGQKAPDMVLFNYRKAGDQQSEEPIPDGFLEVPDALDAVLAYHGVKGYVWNKLFRRELIQRAHARFDTAIGMCEDLLFDVTCLVHATRVYSMNRCLYNYRENPDSALHAIKPEVAKTCLAAHERMLRMVPEASRSAVQASDAIMAEEFLMRAYASHDVRNRDDYRAVLRRYWRQAFAREHSLKYRLRFIGGAWCPALFYRVWNMLKGSSR